MTLEKPYPIGVPGQKWGDAEKAEWLARQRVKRSYASEVLKKLEPLKRRFEVESYGALSFAPDRYPLFSVRSRAWNPNLPTALVTGGVHGYETSGVQGAIRFLETAAEAFAGSFNLVVAPCVSPWAYETVNRWNPHAIDPNRSFRADGASEEASLLMRLADSLSEGLLVHIDLHETTDTDDSEFRPALAARDGVHLDRWGVPDGFYLVGAADKPAPEFQAAIIRSVERVTHIAPPDADGNIIGEPLQQRGVINYAARALGLCAGMTEARYVTTTEVYPDSPRVDPENCIQAQVAAVVGGLNYAQDGGGSSGRC